MEPILDVSDVHKRFPGVLALAKGHLEVLPGEVHALVGENGAGKTTLVNIICGAVQPDQGILRYLGRNYAPRSPQDAFMAGVRVVFQHLSLMPNLTVTENLFLARELSGSLGFIKRREMRAQAEKLLGELGLASISPGARVSGLSTAQKYLVEVAKSLSDRPKLLILDEPTAALNNEQTQLLFSLIEALRDKGAGIVWITHRLEELPQISDRVTVMRDGEYIETRATAGLDREELIRLMTGRAISGSEPPNKLVVGSKELLSIRNLYSSGKLRGLSLGIREGEVVGLGGLAGSGVEDVPRALFGLQRVIFGEISLLGKVCSKGDLRPDLLTRRGVFYLPGDRHREGIIDVRPLIENVTLSSLGALGRVGFINRHRERVTVISYIDRLNVKTPSGSQTIGLLSGGNQQKAMFARGILAQPKIFILEEPTQGVDIGSKSDIYEVIQQLAATGAAVLVISTDTRELLTVCHRILAVCEGQVIREFTHAEADEHVLVSAYFGTQDFKGAV